MQAHDEGCIALGAPVPHNLDAGEERINNNDLSGSFTKKARLIKLGERHRGRRGAGRYLFHVPGSL